MNRKLELSTKAPVPKAYLSDFASVPREKIPYISGEWSQQNPFTAMVASDLHMASDSYMGDRRTSKSPLGALRNFLRYGRDEHGAKVVLLPGNYIDGSKFFNQFQVRQNALHAQMDIFVNELPYEPGIRWVVLGGDDHEAWSMQSVGLDIMLYTAAHARKAGRDDMDFIGFLEADMILSPGKGLSYNRYDLDNPPKRNEKGEIDKKKLDRILERPDEPHILWRIMHGGGGTATALSLTSQKIIESLPGRDKPAVITVGHYHKAIADRYQNCIIMQAGAFQLPTPFMRKRMIPAHIGGWIHRLYQDKTTGSITRTDMKFIEYTSPGHVFNPSKYMHTGDAGHRAVHGVGK